MKLTIGHTPAGEQVGVDTDTWTRLILIGDPGVGKTTLARFLLRWWRADANHDAQVLTPSPHQYADLPARRIGRTGGNSLAARQRRLRVIDGAEALPTTTLRRILNEAGPLVMTTNGPAAWTARAHGGGATDTYLGLLPRPDGRSVYDAAQGRLDWPPETIAVIPAIRGSHDCPRHRWHTLTGATR